MNTTEIDSLISAIQRIAYGDKAAPTGFEALCMAIVGAGMPGAGDTLCAAIRAAGADVKEGLERIAEALAEIK